MWQWEIRLKVKTGCGWGCLLLVAKRKGMDEFKDTQENGREEERLEEEQLERRGREQ